MDVTLPDGTVIKDVPDNITQAQLTAKLKANGLDTSKYEPTIGQEILASPAGRFISGAGEFIDAGAQLLPRALSTVSSLGGLNPNPVSKFLDEQAASVDEGIVKRKAEMDAAKLATNFQGADISRFLGSAASLPNLALMKQLAPMAKTIPGLLESGAYMGMTGGALTPVTENLDNFAGQKAVQTGAGGVFGAALAPVGQLLGRGYELARALAQPFTESGKKAIIGSNLRGQIRPSDIGDVVNRLDQAEGLVPGSQPTVGEISESGGLEAIQRQAASKYPQMFAPREAANVQARREAIGEIAGDVGKKELFETARADAADLLYKQAYKQTLNVNRDPVTGKMLPKADRDAANAEIADLLDTPAIQQAMKDAVILAKNERIDIKDLKGSIQGLDYTKRALDKQIATAEGDNEKRILMGVKERLMSFLQRQSPKYAEAVATYAEGSKPLNQMAVGEYLKNKLVPAVGEEGNLLRENIGSFTEALRNPNTPKLATGFGGNDLEQLFASSPEQLQTLKNIATELARKSNAQDYGRGVGSNTFQNLAMANIAQKTGLPFGLVNMPYLGAPARKIYENATETMQQQLAQALLDPKATAQLIAQAAPSERGRLMAAALRGQLTPAMFGAPTTEFMNQ
jgi:hypothetical protein